MSTVIAQRPRTAAPATTPAPAAAPARTVPGGAAQAWDTDTLARWAMRIDADGIAAHEDRARSVVAAASALGLCPVLVDVLANPAEPAVARERAFGRLALALAHAPGLGL